MSRILGGMGRVAPVHDLVLAGARIFFGGDPFPGHADGIADGSAGRRLGLDAPFWHIYFSHFPGHADGGTPRG